MAEIAHAAYDIELPWLPNWNDQACGQHESQDGSPAAPDPTCLHCGVVPRRHQRVGIIWLYLMTRALLADSTGLGKTVQVAGLLALLQQTGELAADRPGRRALVICRSSTISQWRDELARMVPSLLVIEVTGDARERARKLALYAWDVALIGPEMLVSKTAKGADQLAQFDVGTLVCDDVDALKNINKTARTIRQIANRVDRMIVTNATPIDKRLTQLYDIGVPLRWPIVLGQREEYLHHFVETRKVWYTPRYKPTRCKMCKGTLTADTRRKVWVDEKTREQGPCPSVPARQGMPSLHLPVVRYTPEPKSQTVEVGPNLANLPEFRARLDLLVMRRTDAEVDDVTMPRVVASQVWLTLNRGQRERYDEIKAGVLSRINELGRKISRQEAENWWMRAWQITSSLANLDARGDESCKLDWATDTITGDLAAEPVVVYCYFKPTLAALSRRLERAGVRTSRIWGDEPSPQARDENLALWRAGRTRVMLITDAGGSGLNLQHARRLVIVDTPRSAARLTQIVGREKRDGSRHETVYVSQLLARGTLDEPLVEMVSREAMAAAQVLDGGRLPAEFSWEPEQLMLAIAGNI